MFTIVNLLAAVATTSALPVTETRSTSASASATIVAAPVETAAISATTTTTPATPTTPAASAASAASAAGAAQAPATTVPVAGERKWTGSVAASASVASGNTDKNTFGAAAQAENRGEKDRWTAQLLWNYSDEKGLGVTQRRTYGQIKYDYFIEPKLYVFGVASGESDYAAALDLRTTVGAGVGYQFREDKEWKISGEAGLSYVDENFSTSGDDKAYLAARFAYKADWTYSEKWSIGQWGELFPSLENSEDISARIDTHTRLNLTDKMFAQLQHIYTWDNTPATGADRVDELWLLSIGWSF